MTETLTGGGFANDCEPDDFPVKDLEGEPDRPPSPDDLDEEETPAALSAELGARPSQGKLAAPNGRTFGGAGDRPSTAEPTPAGRGVSAVGANSKIPWAAIAGLTAILLVGGWFLVAAVGSGPKAAPPPPPVAPPPAPRPPDLMEAKPVPVASKTIPVANVPGPMPQRTRADELMEKSRQAPLMAVQTQDNGSPPSAQRGSAARAAGSPVTSDRAGSRIQRVKAVQLGSPMLRLSAGTVIPCILDTALDTTLAGFVRCHVPQDVYSANQSVVLLDAGTLILGEYQAGLKQGQERIGIVWTRAETPESVTIDLSSPGTDALGRAGVDGEVETYFWTRFGAAMMFSLLSDAGAIGRSLAVNALGNGSSNNNTYVYSNLGSSTQNNAQTVGQETLRQTLSIPPVLKKNQGERVNILVRNDLDFADVYSVERR
jgi:type IV secretion system protein VirB10